MKKNVKTLILFLFVILTDYTAVAEEKMVEKTIKPEVIGERQFKCEGFEGLSFVYPNLKNWEIGSISQDAGNPNKCIMLINYPDWIDFDMHPQVIIEKTSIAKLEQNKISVFVTEPKVSSVLQEFIVAKTVNLPDKIKLFYGYNPKNYVKDFNPKPHFYDSWLFQKDKKVYLFHIYSGSSEDGWNSDLFMDKIIETIGIKDEN